MVTIREVSILAGVSSGTVSNVLTGKRPVSDTLRKQVMDAIDELGYQPNLVASSLVTGRSKTIVVMMNDFQRVSEEFLIGVDHGARENGYSLLISRMEINKNPINHLKALMNRQIDGVIWTMPELDDDLNLWKTHRDFAKLPLVNTFGGLVVNQSYVGVDNFLAGYSATLHLIDHGCKNIGHLSGPKSSLEARNRKLGWQKAINEKDYNPKIECECDWEGKKVEQCIFQMLEKWPELDGLFAVNDLCALSSVMALHKMNRVIPEQVKVIGFDDIRYLNYIQPSLSSVRQDFYQIGLVAANELIRRIQHPDSIPQNRLIPTELISRHSCGCK